MIGTIHQFTMSSLSRVLLVCFLLSISGRSWGQPSATAIDNPTCSSSAQPNSPFFGSFLEAYTETVDTIVGLQTTTWNYIARYNHFDEGKVDNLCEVMKKAHLYTNVPKFAKYLDSEIQNQTTTTKWEPPADFRNDKESDINGYFSELAEACSKDIADDSAAETYAVECLDRLKDTVYEPRCTTRYDSRVECNGEDIASELVSPSELIAEHFSLQESDQLHVVIVGSGPVGLMLGNALSMLQRTHSEVPPIKILFLETRADAPGVKRGYTRNWQAHLNFLHFKNRMDPRLMKIFRSMTKHNTDDSESANVGFVFPLNVIETLLMLSNRDLGAAKFLFGVNPLDIVEDLKKVPNLVLVDTTGHRLEPLRRGPACDSEDDKAKEDSCAPEEQTEILNHRTPAAGDVPWKNLNNEFYDNMLTFKQDFTKWHDIVEDKGQQLAVGKSGDVMYPIDENTKVAKSMWWLDIHGAMPLTNAGFMRERAQQTDALFAGEGPFCKWCKEWFEEHEDPSDLETEEDKKTNYICNNMCYSQYWAQSTMLFREDINENIFNGNFDDTFVYHTDSWFPLMGYAFNPSPTLAGHAEKVFVESGYANDPIGMPLKEFYPALSKNLYGEENDDDDYYGDDDDDYEGEEDTTGLSESDWALVGALERYTYQSASETWPKVTLFAQQPFIYTNGIKKKNKCLGTSSTNIGDHLEHAPMIRFGDSFTTGDGLNGAGLFTHAAMVGVFMDAILDKSMALASTKVA